MIAGADRDRETQTRCSFDCRGRERLLRVLLALKTFLLCTFYCISIALHCALPVFVKLFSLCALHASNMSSLHLVIVLRCSFLFCRALHSTFLSCTAGKSLWSAQGRWRRCCARLPRRLATGLLQGQPPNHFCSHHSQNKAVSVLAKSWSDV